MFNSEVHGNVSSILRCFKERLFRSATFGDGNAGKVAKRKSLSDFCDKKIGRDMMTVNF